MTPPQSPPDPLQQAMDRLRRATRVPMNDRPVLAAAIGRLAERLDPDRPLRGARAIFDEATGAPGAVLWDKRKRVLRLPGEPCPPPGREGDYAGRGTNFNLVAQAAIRLLAGTGIDSLASRRRLIREVLSGTSFLPATASLVRSDADAMALLDKFAAKIGRQVLATSRLATLWKLLETAPIKLGSSYGTKRPRLTGMAAEVYDYPCAFSIGKSAGSQGWARPALPIGVAVHTVPALLFRLPPTLAQQMAKLDDDEVPRDIVDFLTKINWKAGQYDDDGPFRPACRYSHEREYGWEPVDLRLARRLWLRTVPNSDGGATLVLEVEGGHDMSLRPDWQLLFEPDLSEYDEYCGRTPNEDAAVVALRTKQQARFCRQVEIGHDFSLALWPTAAGDPEDLTRRARDGFSGFYHVADWRHSWDFEQVPSGWSDSPAIRDVLASPHFTFHPEIEAPEADTPFPEQTVAAALIRHVLAIPSEQGVAGVLAARAEALAEAAFSFWEDVHARADAALDA